MVPSQKRAKDRRRMARMAPKPSTARMSTATPRYSLWRWMPLRPEYALRIPLNCGIYVLINSSSGNEYVVA